ncbi:MAG: hypothetical protein ACI8PZ_007348 [Myxococcota bacterium]
MAPLKFLDDYLAQPDFQAALAPLARDFRRTLGLPDTIDELGLVCSDVVEAADYLQSTYPGMGTFMLAEGSPVKFSTGGDEVQYRTRVGFAYYQGVLLELAEAGTGSDIFSTHLDPGGRITLHHMGFFARGDAHRIGSTKYAPRLSEMGYAAPEWSAKVFAGMTINVSIYETYDAAQGMALEFLDFRLLGLPVDYPKAAAQAFAVLQNKVGPRVITLPGPGDDGAKLQWSLHRTLTLKATPEQVFTACTDPTQLAAWWDATVTVVEEGLGGPGGVGTKRRVVSTLGKHDIDSVQTITESVHPMLLRYTASDTGVFDTMAAVMTITRDDPGTTEIVWQVSFVPEDLLTGLPLVKQGDDWMEAALDRLAASLDPSAVGTSVRRAEQGFHSTT